MAEAIQMVGDIVASLAFYLLVILNATVRIPGFGVH